MLAFSATTIRYSDFYSHIVFSIYKKHNNNGLQYIFLVQHWSTTKKTTIMRWCSMEIERNHRETTTTEKKFYH